jgi:hypothetical protein
VTSSDLKKAEHEPASGIIKPLSESGDAEGLTGSSSDQNVNCLQGPLCVFIHVSQIFDGRVVVLQDSRRESLDLGERHGFPAKRMPGDGSRFDPRADR